MDYILFRFNSVLNGAGHSKPGFRPFPTMLRVLYGTAPRRLTEWARCLAVGARPTASSHQMSALRIRADCLHAYY